MLGLIVPGASTPPTSICTRPRGLNDQPSLVASLGAPSQVVSVAGLAVALGAVCGGMAARAEVSRFGLGLGAAGFGPGGLQLHFERVDPLRHPGHFGAHLAQLAGDFGIDRGAGMGG